jgi:DNA-binding response OmpR family regulator
VAKILVIDDDTGIRSMLEIALSRQGHTVACAKDGKAGLTAFASTTMRTSRSSAPTCTGCAR